MSEDCATLINDSLTYRHICQYLCRMATGWSRRQTAALAAGRGGSERETETEPGSVCTRRKSS